MQIRLSLLLVALTTNALAYYPQWVRTGVDTAIKAEVLRTGDFNGDGRPDIVVRDRNYVIYLLPTDSEGKPGAPVSVLTADYSADFAVADFDGDGKADIAVGNVGYFGVTVLRGKGDGTFEAPVTTYLPYAATQLAAADFNSDGRTDLAVLSYSASQPNLVAILRGDGVGRFVELSRTPAKPYAILAGDVDGDGHADLLVARYQPLGYDLFFGKGDGTFEPPKPFDPPFARQFLLADLDGDGDREIFSTDTTAMTLTVELNLGARTFAAPDAYPLAQPHDRFTGAFSMAVGEVTGDDHADVVVSLPEGDMVATYPGNGDGSLRDPECLSLQVAHPTVRSPGPMALEDFTGDGRLDLALGSMAAKGVGIYANASGHLRIDLQSTYKVVSEGWPITVDMFVNAAHDTPMTFPAPTPTGTLTLWDGATVLGSDVPKNNAVKVNIPGLTAGTHVFVVEYSGDGEYRPMVSAPFIQKVVAEKTIPTLKINSGGQATMYGQELILTVDVQSPIPGSVAGRFAAFVDGLPRPDLVGPPFNWHHKFLTPGTHTFRVRYEGNDIQPPSWSNTVTQVIRRATSKVALRVEPVPVEAGKSPAVRVELSGDHGGVPQGRVRIYEGSDLLTTTIITGSADVELPPLSPGTHHIRASYDGDVNFESSVSAGAQITVTPAAPQPPRRRGARH